MRGANEGLDVVRFDDDTRAGISDHLGCKVIFRRGQQHRAARGEIRKHLGRN